MEKTLEDMFTNVRFLWIKWNADDSWYENSDDFRSIRIEILLTRDFNSLNDRSEQRRE